MFERVGGPQGVLLAKEDNGEEVEVIPQFHKDAPPQLHSTIDMFSICTLM